MPMTFNHKCHLLDGSMIMLARIHFVRQAIGVFLCLPVYSFKQHNLFALCLALCTVWISPSASNQMNCKVNMCPALRWKRRRFHALNTRNQFTQTHHMKTHTYIYIYISHSASGQKTTFPTGLLLINYNEVIKK